MTDISIDIYTFVSSLFGCGAICFFVGGAFVWFFTGGEGDKS